MAAQENPPPHEGEDTHKPVKFVLIVEDDRDIGEVILQALQLELPHKTLLVTDGQQALTFVNQIKPQLLIMDYHLPHMNGLELYDHLQAREELKDIPVLFMSANVPTGELERRRVYYVRKPFELDELLGVVEQLLAETA